MRHLFTVSVLLGISASLTGCVDHIAERQGAEIQLVPVTYSIGISIKQGQEEKARQELDTYVQSHWNKVTTQNVRMLWYTGKGKTLADNYYRYLLGLGIDKTKLHLQEAPQGMELVPFDMQLQTVVHRAVVEVCDYEKIGNYGMSAQGCYTDSARWQSMVAPEKMLSPAERIADPVSVPQEQP
ncbi:hypothetical protein CSW98_11095 [Vibrio sp. HA2012]|uniref:hypothetical protein n=1 Tax=Vibrio sp. HA2012 TaxID=1971595 RepID=UPI000C2B598B|nr:hypothetical protein [Vibrio sp. HA2012]PJC86111.1 hypothetical protein CSW98_11095 [Vibrio sp. HA2012]